jgi:hypothetical protein
LASRSLSASEDGSFKIVNYYILLAITSKDMGNLMPKIEPKLINEIALKRKADYWLFIVDPKADAIDF